MTVRGKNIKSPCSRFVRASKTHLSVTHAHSITRRDRTVPLRERRWTETHGKPHRGTRRAKRR